MLTKLILKNLQNLKLIKRNLLQEFYLNIILILLEVKDSYLIDLFILSVNQIKVVLTVFLLILQYKKKILIIQLNEGPSDFLILTIAQFKRKFEELFDRFIIINLSQEERGNILKVEEEERFLIEEYLLKQLNPLNDLCLLPENNLIMDSNDNSTEKFLVFPIVLEPNLYIGYEFLAGWFLGYPVIYNSPLLSSSSSLSSSVGSVLSMQSLCKITVTVNVNFPCNELEPIEEMVVQQFTYPESFHHEFSNRIQDQFHQIASTRREQQSQEMNSSGCDIRWNATWNYHQEIVICPALSL